MLQIDKKRVEPVSWSELGREISWADMLLSTKIATPPCDTCLSFINDISWSFDWYGGLQFSFIVYNVYFVISYKQ